VPAPGLQNHQYNSELLWLSCKQRPCACRCKQQPCCCNARPKPLPALCGFNCRSQLPGAWHQSASMHGACGSGMAGAPVQRAPAWGSSTRRSRRSGEQGVVATWPLLSLLQQHSPPALMRHGASQAHVHTQTGAPCSAPGGAAPSALPPPTRRPAVPSLLAAAPGSGRGRAPLQAGAAGGERSVVPRAG
jgi:hypothetical protein